MADDTPSPRDWTILRTRLIGAGALLVWIALLWFMFGDVL